MSCLPSPAAHNFKNARTLYWSNLSYDFIMKASERTQELYLPLNSVPKKKLIKGIPSYLLFEITVQYSHSTNFISWVKKTQNGQHTDKIFALNLLATDFFFQILAHPVFKMWVIQKPNKVALWNKRHFEGEKMEIIHHVWNIQYGYLLNKYIKLGI